MTPPIEVDFAWDERHYAAAVRAYLSSRGNRLGTWFVLFFGVYLAGTAVWMLAQSRRAWPLAALYLVLALAMFFLRGPFMTVWIRRRYRRRPDQGARVRYRFDDEGVRGETEGLATSEIRWAMLGRAIVCGDSLLLFVTPRQYLYVPLGAEREPLLALVRSKVEKVAA